MRGNLAASLLAIALLTSCGNGSTTETAVVASPCASPYADSATDVYAAVPQDGSVKVSLAVGQHLVVGWSGCNMAGRISVPDGEVLRVTDGQSEYRAGPQVNVRYLAEKEGTVDVTGQREGRTGRITVVVQHR